MAKVRVGFTIDALGLTQMVGKLKTISTPGERKAILRKGASIGARYLKKNTPEDTGNLVKSTQALTWRRSGDYFFSHKNKGGPYKKGDKSVPRDPFYAAFQNEGFTVNGVVVNKHKGYIQKSVKEAAPEAQAKIRDEVDKFIKKYSRYGF